MGPLLVRVELAPRIRPSVRTPRAITWPTNKPTMMLGTITVKVHSIPLLEVHSFITQYTPRHITEQNRGRRSSSSRRAKLFECGVEVELVEQQRLLGCRRLVAHAHQRSRAHQKV